MKKLPFGEMIKWRKAKVIQERLQRNKVDYCFFWLILLSIAANATCSE